MSVLVALATMCAGWPGVRANFSCELGAVLLVVTDFWVSMEFPATDAACAGRQDCKVTPDMIAANACEVSPDSC